MFCIDLIIIFKSSDMGNQLLKGYDLKGEPIPGVGGNKMWKMFHGIRQSTNTAVTIFAIEKRTLKSSERE